MEAYQVFKGDIDKHGREYTELIATYLDKQRAFNHVEQIAKEAPLYSDILEFDGWYGDGKYCSWSAVGWDRTCIALLTTIEITE
jgi:hypothetical protein